MPFRSSRHQPQRNAHQAEQGPQLNLHQPPVAAEMSRDSVAGTQAWGYAPNPAGPSHNGYTSPHGTYFPAIFGPGAATHVPPSALSWPGHSHHHGQHQNAAPPQQQQQDEEDYQLNLAIEQSLRESHQSRPAPLRESASSRQPPTQRDFSERGQAVALSFKYWSTGCLTYAETVLDGFYMTDDQFPEVCETNEFPKLDDLQRVPVLEDDLREVICIDSKQDPILDQLKDRAREAIARGRSSDSASLLDKGQKIEALANIVAEYFGGSYDSDEALAAVWRHTSAAEKKFKGSVVIPLGRLRGGGSSRHRALLFKILADSQNIKCQLLTGRNLGISFSDDTAMNQVVVQGKYCLVDLVHQAGRLIPCDEQQEPATSPGSASCSAGNPQLHGGRSGTVASSHASSFSESAAGMQRPKAQSESNLQGNQQGPAGPLRVNELAVPDLIRLDSGPLPEAIDCSWAKFPSASMASASSGLSLSNTAATAPANLVAGPPVSGGAAAGRVEPSGVSSNNGHHGHSHSVDLGTIDIGVCPAHGGQHGATPSFQHGFAAAPTIQQQSGFQPTAPSPFAAPAAGGSMATASTGVAYQPGQPYQGLQHQPLHHHQQQLQPQHQFQRHQHHHKQQQQQHGTNTGGAISHWVSNQVQSLGNQIASSSSKAVQGLAAAMAPSATSASPWPLSHATSNTSNGGSGSPGQPQNHAAVKQPGPTQGAVASNLKGGVVSKSFADANEPFADLSPFKSMPLMPGTLPKAMSQYLAQGQQQQQNVGVRRTISNTPLSSSLNGAGAATAEGFGAASMQQQVLGAGGHPMHVQHSHSRSNSSMEGGPEGHSGFAHHGSGSNLFHGQTSARRSDEQSAPVNLQSNGSGVGQAPGHGHAPPLNAAPRPSPAISAFAAIAVPGLQQSSPFQQSPPGSTAPQTSPPAARLLWPAQPQQLPQQLPPVDQLNLDGPPHPLQPMQPTRADFSRLPSLHLQNKDWEIDPKELKYSARIGHGSYGEVYKGEWRLTDVAIKKFLQQTLSKTVVREFKQEVSIMYTLKHPNIVLFMGAVVQTEQLAIVTQYIARGSLFNQLHQCPVCNKVQVEQLTPKRRLAIARDIAKGMHYLHSCTPPIVHRDLKSANLLVDKDWTIKVCDFGLSQVKRAAFLTAKTEMGGTAEWMAPEVLRSDACTEKCDLFSYGVILYELVTGEKPWSHCQNRAQVIGAVGYNKQRLELPTDLQPEVAQLVTDCWKEAPEQRPSFAEVLERLSILKELTPSPTRMAAAKEEDLSNCANH